MLDSPTLQKKTVFAIGLIYAVRMLGLFIVLPTFSIYASTLQQATPFLLGIAFGIYGLTQAILQIPFGYLSDYYGRKIIIYFGLILFCIGSIVCAMTDSIYWMILGRTLQGGGAIGSALLALLADQTPEQVRPKAMAIIGMFIGSSVFLGILLGSILSGPLGSQGLFWLTVGLALLGMFALYRWIPTSALPTPTLTSSNYSSSSSSSQLSFLQLLSNPELIRLNIGTFFQHALFTIWLYALPFLLNPSNTAENHSFAAGSLWLFYLVTLVMSFICMVPLLLLVQKKHWIKQGFIIAVASMVIVYFAISITSPSVTYLAVCFFIYLVAFNLLEAWLPSLTANAAPRSHRGAAMGIYSTFQFLGIFFGGLLSGWFHQTFSISSLFYSCVIMTLVWLGTAVTLRVHPTTTQPLVYPKPIE